MLLVWLSESPDRRMRMTELAERSKITRSRLSHAVARLEKDGWVAREDCPTDRRGQVAVLTDQGRAALLRRRPATSRRFAPPCSTGWTPTRSVSSATSCAR